MYSNEPYSQRPPAPPRPRVWPVLLLLILGATLGLLILDKGLGWKFWPHKNPDFAEAAKPRDVVAREQLSDVEKQYINIYNEVAPSVVHVSNIAERPNYFNFNDQSVVRGTGSGFIWKLVGNDGAIIVTNAHVVQGADAVNVILNDKDHTTLETKAWVPYPDKDLAVLYVNAPANKLHPIPRIGSSSNLKVGQMTFAIGNPFGLDHTYTAGIVSALNREINSVTNHAIQGVIQTSAAINPGNSGGPLLDSSGSLIGVNTAILSPSGTFAGIGFAIPVDEVNDVVPNLVAKLDDALRNNADPRQEVTPPRLGVVLGSEEQAARFGVEDGVLITFVQSGSPAAKAGLRGCIDPITNRIRVGDVITAMDGKPIKKPSDVHAVLGNHQPGDEITVTIQRNGHDMDKKVTLAATIGRRRT